MIRNVLILAFTILFTASSHSAYDPTSLKGASSSVDSEVVLYSGTGGKTSKRATGTGFAKLSSGVLSASSTVDLASETTGVLAPANGGSGKNMTVVNGGVVWTDGDSMEVIAAGTSGQLLKSNGAAAPSWVTSSASTTPCYYQFAGAAETSVCSGTCTEYYDSCSIFSTPTRSGAGAYSVTAPAGSFANNQRLFMTCQAFSDSSTATGRKCYFQNNTSKTPLKAASDGSVAILIGTDNSANSGTDAIVSFEIIGLP